MLRLLFRTYLAGDAPMSVVETERNGAVFIVSMNRPELMNALGTEMRAELAAAFSEFNESRDLEVAIYTGTGRAFCAGEDMKETVERGGVGTVARPKNPYHDGSIDKPVIA